MVLPSMDRAKHTRDNVEPHDVTAVAHLSHFGVTRRAFSAAIKCFRVRSRHTLPACLPPLAVLRKVPCPLRTSRSQSTKELRPSCWESSWGKGRQRQPSPWTCRTREMPMPPRRQPSRSQRRSVVRPLVLGAMSPIKWRSSNKPASSSKRLPSPQASRTD